MSSDRLNINVEMLDPQRDSEGANTIHSIGVSMIRPYLAASFGADAPYDPLMHTRATIVFNAATALSTDPWLVEPDLEKLTKYVPHFLSLAEPMVDANKALGKSVDQKLDDFEQRFDQQGAESVSDLRFGVSLFDLITDLASMEFNVAPPRPLSDAIKERIDRVKPAQHELIVGNPDELDILSFMIETPFVKAEHKRKIERLREQVAKMGSITTSNLTRTALVAASLETSDLWDAFGLNEPS